MMTFMERVALAVAVGLMLLMVAVTYPKAAETGTSPPIEMVCDSVEDLLAYNPDLTFSPMSESEIEALIALLGAPPFEGWDQIWIASGDGMSELEFIGHGCVLGWSSVVPTSALMRLIGRSGT